MSAFGQAGRAAVVTRLLHAVGLAPVPLPPSVLGLGLGPDVAARNARQSLDELRARRAEREEAERAVARAVEEFHQRYGA